MADKKSEKLIDKKGIRLDGRKVDELRPVKMEVGVLPNADGSAYLEQGRNKVLVGVYGPKEAHPRHIAQQDRAVIQCRGRWVGIGGRSRTDSVGHHFDGTARAVVFR